MATFRISWQTLEGEQTDWIWARDLKHAEMIAGDREFEALMPEMRERQMLYNQALGHDQSQLRAGCIGSRPSNLLKTPHPGPFPLGPTIGPFHLFS